MTDVARCERCDRPITSDDQTCTLDGSVDGQRWPCVRPDDPSVFEAPVGDGTLKVKAGWGIRPVPILADPYAIDGDRETP